MCKKTKNLKKSKRNFPRGANSEVFGLAPAISRSPGTVVWPGTCYLKKSRRHTVVFSELNTVTRRVSAPQLPVV